MTPIRLDRGHPIIVGVVAACLLGLLAAPAAGLPARAPGSVTPPFAAVPVADDAPGSAARVAAAVAALPGIVEQAMAQTGAPGAAVSVVHDGRLVYSQGFGVRSTQSPEPVTPETVFQLASYSKSIGASVVAAAIGRGVADWDTRVVALLPWFELKSRYVTENVTIGDLYTMVSGLPGGAGDPLEMVGYSRKQILKRLRHLPLTAPFRTAHQYTNFGMTAGGEAIAQATGESWADIAEEFVFRPLGMDATSERYSDFLSRSNRAALHVRIDGAMVPRYTRDADAQAPAGGVSSTVLDLARWMIMELSGGTFEGRRIVAAEPLAAAQTAHSRTTPVSTAATVPRLYGYGMGVGFGHAYNMRLNHSGAFTQGAGTTYLMIPEYGVGITVLANAMVGLPEIVASSFGDIVETGAVTQDWAAEYIPLFAGYYAPNPGFEPDQRPADPEPARRMGRYVGEYRNGFWGTATVRTKNGRLQLLLGPDRVVVPLEHWDGDEFAATFGIGFDWPSRFGVTFGGGGTGDARTVELAAGPGQVGLLRRVPQA